MLGQLLITDLNRVGNVREILIAACHVVQKLAVGDGCMTVENVQHTLVEVCYFLMTLGQRLIHGRSLPLAARL